MKHRLLEETEGRRKFVLVGAGGEEAVAAIRDFAVAQSIGNASLTGIGAFSRASLGWFNPVTSEFRQNEIEEQVELLSMIGNLALEDGAPKLHLHVVLGRGDATTRGGHLVAGWIRPTLEVVLTEAPGHLTRAHDPASGLVLLQP